MTFEDINNLPPAGHDESAFRAMKGQVTASPWCAGRETLRQKDGSECAL